MNDSLCFDGFAAVSRETAAVREKVWSSGSRPNPTLRLVLLHNEVFLQPRSFHVLHVLSGKAWVSFEGNDRIMESGESLVFSRLRNGAVISATGKEALLFEVIKGELDT